MQAGFSPIYGIDNYRRDASGVQTFVDPSQYPLAYGKRQVLARGGRVLCDGRISSTNFPASEQAPTPRKKHLGVEEVQKRIVSGVESYDAWCRAFPGIGWEAIQKISLVIRLSASAK